MSNRQKLPPGAIVKPVNSLRKQDGTFARGISGNPRGRPKGARNHIARALDKVAATDAAAVLRTTIARAKKGDIAAARLIMRRAWPVPKGRPLQGLVLPPIKQLADAVAAMSAITAGISRGLISTEEARDLTEILDVFRKIHELADIEQRIADLERQIVRTPGE